MASNIARRILNVFIASPGDLAEERRAAKRVVDELNETVSRRLGWQIELLGWEETLPGHGRPQELINRDVESCDLFVALLWRRWGQSSRKYSSGFEEEFELARKRCNETKSPEIWLFFKKVEEEQLKDPGEQLKRVLEFRQAQISAKELLFKNFDDVEDWRAKLHKYLLQYLLDLALAAGLPIEKELAVSSPIPQDGEASVPSSLESKSDESPALLQYKNLMNSISRVMASTEFNFPIEEERSKDEFYAGRLHLLAMAWISSRYTNELLSVHEINLLYRHREQLETTDVEATLILETLIGNSSDTTPGWYWFSSFSQDAVERLLFYLSLNGRDTFVRQRSVEMIKAINTAKPIELSQRKKEIEYILKDQSEEVRKAGLNYIGAVAGIEDIPLIDPLLSGQEASIRNEAERIKLLIISRSNPHDALRELATNQALVFVHNEIDSFLKEIGKGSGKIQSELLLDIIQNQDVNVTIRIFALREISQRRLLSKEVLLPLLADSSSYFKAACFEELIKMGEAINSKTIREAIPRQDYGKNFGFFPSISRPPDANDLVLSLYKSLPLERILPHIHWYSADGEIAYSAMATTYGNEVLTRLRSDLKNQFQQLQKESINQMQEKFGAEIEQVIESYKELDGFIRYRFSKAALAGLALYGGPEDAEIAREYLKEHFQEMDYYDDLKIEAVHILSRFGNESDASLLLEIANDKYGTLQSEAAIAALKLSPGITGIASIFLNSADITLVNLAIDSLKEHKQPEVQQVLQPLLNHKTDSVRIKALTYFIETLSRKELTALLKTYLEQPIYFYNVVCWLDRTLYAPSPLREVYQQRLHQ